jgi:hypothetical protein
MGLCDYAFGLAMSACMLTTILVGMRDVVGITYSSKNGALNDVYP